MDTAVASQPIAKSRPFWKRRLLDPVVRQLTQGITPEKIALTLAVGGSMALFPIMGLTTILCLIVGIVLRLNQPILHLLNQALLPMHVMVIYACVRWGEKLFGVVHDDAGIRGMAKHMNHLFWSSQVQFWHEFGALLWHAIIVWAMLAPIFIAVVYVISLPIMRSIARWKVRAVDKPAALL